MCVSFVGLTHYLPVAVVSSMTLGKMSTLFILSTCRWTLAIRTFLGYGQHPFQVQVSPGCCSQEWRTGVTYCCSLKSEAPGVQLRPPCTHIIHAFSSCSWPGTLTSRWLVWGWRVFVGCVSSFTLLYFRLPPTPPALDYIFTRPMVALTRHVLPCRRVFSGMWLSTELVAPFEESDSWILR